MHRRLLWQCKACGLQTSVTAGTVMHKTRTPLVLWFWAAYLVATHTPGISAVQLQRQLGISRYETAWLILHKLRGAMINPSVSRFAARSRSTRPTSADAIPCVVAGASATARRSSGSRSRSAARAPGACA